MTGPITMVQLAPSSLSRQVRILHKGATTKFGCFNSLGVSSTTEHPTFCFYLNLVLLSESTNNYEIFNYLLSIYVYYVMSLFNRCKRLPQTSRHKKIQAATTTAGTRLSAASCQCRQAWPWPVPQQHRLLQQLCPLRARG